MVLIYINFFEGSVVIKCLINAFCPATTDKIRENPFYQHAILET